MADVQKLEHALGKTKRTEHTDIAYVDLKPYPHQTEILEKLEAERTRHNRLAAEPQDLPHGASRRVVR